MNIQYTKYFKSLVSFSTKPVITFKDNDFSSISFDSIKTNEFNEIEINELKNLLYPDEYEKLYICDYKTLEPYERRAQFDSVISYKTIKNLFYNQDRLKEQIPPLTGVFYIPCKINFIRTLNDVNITVSILKNDSDVPWFSRQFMSPTLINDITIVADVKEVDTYLSETTVQRERAKNKSWIEYIDYYDTCFKSLANQNIEYENNCFIFRYSIIDSTSEINKLYSKLLESEVEHPLYNKFMQKHEEPSCTLISNSDANAMSSHCGQMNGEYPLSDSQRESVHHMNLSYNGDILAVSGPPGTGKTTLLQTIVADLVVKHAIKDIDPPVIVASSTNNQAVTNIIDSFGQINSVGISNIEKRWINGVHSFASYFPSNAKMNSPQYNNYHKTSIRGCEFITEVEKLNSDNISLMLKNGQEYFNTTFATIDKLKKRLHDELVEINGSRDILINEVKKADDFSDGNDLVECMHKLEEKKEESYIKIERYRNRCNQWYEINNKIPLFFRLTSFIPYFRKRVSNLLSLNINSQEIDFIDNSMNLEQIEAKYSHLIEYENIKIRELDQKIAQAQEIILKIKNLLSQLSDKNCKLPIIDDEMKLTKCSLKEINKLIDTHIRYVEFWLAVHINECRFLSCEFQPNGNQRGKTFENVLNKFYKQLALLTPCMVMTLYMLPKNFLAFDTSYLFDYIDLLIIDEAGQCLPEIAAPSFSLAKKAIVVGDEMQIPPVWNVDYQMDILLAIQELAIKSVDDYKTLEENGLNGCQSSVMKIAKKSCKYNKYDRGLFLSEHRRCFDEIIGYCNELVYSGKLIPCRGSGTKNKEYPLDINKYPLIGYYDIETESSEKKGSSRVNVQEAEAIAAWIKTNYDEICSAYKSKDNEINKRTVLAIITPFKAQTYIIKKSLKDLIGEKADHITVGTVHAFQGGERKIIIFSTVYGSKDGCFFIDNNKNLINVAVSRSKDAFWVFGSNDCINKRPKNTASGLLNQYISNNKIN